MWYFELVDDDDFKGGQKLIHTVDIPVRPDSGKLDHQYDEIQKKEQDGLLNVKNNLEGSLAASTNSENVFYVAMDIHCKSGEKRVVFEINPSWSPLGATRFRELVESNYYEGVKFYRVIHVSAYCFCPFSFLISIWPIYSRILWPNLEHLETRKSPKFGIESRFKTIP